MRDFSFKMPQIARKTATEKQKQPEKNKQKKPFNNHQPLLFVGYFWHAHPSGIFFWHRAARLGILVVPWQQRAIPLTTGVEEDFSLTNYQVGWSSMNVVFLWLVGNGCHFQYFPYFPINLGNVIIPIDEIIFFRGGPTTNQIVFLIVFTRWKRPIAPRMNFQIEFLVRSQWSQWFTMVKARQVLDRSVASTSVA